MKSIILHIEYLLQRTDCLILPGIGALIAERVPARFDEQEGMIYPPMRMISLNPSITHDDGMLATSIARAESVKFEEGRLMMQEMISSLRAILCSEGEASLGRIGVLKLKEDDTISLLSFRSPERNASDTGLPKARLHSVIRKEENPELLSASSSPAAIVPEDPDIEMRPFSRKNYYIPINKIFAKCAASIVVLTIVALSFIMPQRNAINERISASMNPVETLMSQSGSQRDLPATTVTPAQDTPEDMKVEDSAVRGADSDAIVEITAPAESQNYLIVATFKTRQEAETFIEMRKGGSYTLSAVKGKNVWRISAGEGDRETLRSLLNTPEFQSAFAEAWIWSAS